jgi:tripartite-type tricarboxylate transporter receptor subunit TctC
MLILKYLLAIATLGLFNIAQAINPTEGSYPNKVIHIFTSAAGGGNDLVARLIGQSLTLSLSQSVIIENRTGIISVEQIAKSTPDGYNLLVIGSSLWIDPLMSREARWDALEDFSPITLAVTSPNVLVVHPSINVNSTRQLIALAKNQPGVLNYASAGSGSNPHIAAELFKYMAHVNIVRVIYKGTGQALNDILAGQCQIAFTPIGSVMSHIKSGKLQALAVTSLKPTSLYPDLPSISDSGLSGYEAVSTYGVFSPAKTPASILQRLNVEIVKLLNESKTKDKLRASGSESVGTSPKVLTDRIRADILRFSKILKYDSGE